MKSINRTNSINEENKIIKEEIKMFNPGDIVKGNNKNFFGITNREAIMEVIESSMLPNGREVIKVKVLTTPVCPDKFVGTEYADLDASLFELASR